MSRRLPPLTWFRAFEAAARTLSFTAAAEEIGLTQSAVSQQIKSLELRLGAPLFVRKPRSLALTDAGRKLLPQVGAALGVLAQATEPFDAGAGPNLLTVATSVSVAQWLVSPRLPEFTARHPHVRIRLLSAVWPDDFQTSQADVEIRFGSKAQAGPGARALEPNLLVPVKAPDVAGGPEDLPLIETVGTSGGWRAWQDRYGPLETPAIYTDTYGLAMQMAADGNGVALVSALLARHAVASGQLVYAAEGSVAAQEGYFLRAEKAPMAAVFADWVEAALCGADG